MRLHDVHSADLLPRFANDAEWEQNALDVFVISFRAASYGLGAPYSMQAIEALDDSDLMAYYAQYGIAIYYPDLSRQTRNDMLFELARIYRYLGTPYAVQLLCRYIFDESESVMVEVVDNIAWENGELVDSSLLDLFDLEISFSSPVLTPEKHARIIENVFRFCRNSQTLRDTIYIFPGEFSLPVGVAHGDHAGIGVVYENEMVAQLPPMDFILVDANGQIKSGIQYTSNSFTGTGHVALQDASEVVETGTGHVALQDANEVVFVENEPEPEPEYLDVFFYYNAGGSVVTFEANDYWSTCIRNDSDKAALENFGVPIGTADNGRQFVARTAADSFTFTPLALYSGDGTGELHPDMSNFYCTIREDASPGSIYTGICIQSIDPYRVNTQTWKCRITRINGGN
jgi:hypothetical protein